MRILFPCFNKLFYLLFQSIAWMMKALSLLVRALLLHLPVTSAHGSWNASLPIALDCEVDVRCDCALTPNGFWDATCGLNGSLRSPSPFVLFESL